MPDKFKATWVSHTSMTDFLTCPRAYFLKNVYKDPKSNHKIKLMSAPLALGQAVHETLENLSQLPTKTRFIDPLMPKFDQSWEKVSGKVGGFTDKNEEYRYQERGRAMIRRVQDHPGPIAELSIKIQQDLPWFWLSEEEEIILCGKVDWLEYLEASDSVHIIDFKTGKNKEHESSLQLPIYHLLVDRCQKRQVAKASYWYLETDDALTEKELPSLEDAEAEILQIARKMKLARQLKKFDCTHGEEGCFACRNYEKILAGQAEFVGVDEYNYDVYIMPGKSQDDEDREGMIL